MICVTCCASSELRPKRNFVPTLKSSSATAGCRLSRVSNVSLPATEIDLDLHKCHTRHNLVHPTSEHFARLGVVELKENDMKKLVLVVAVLLVAVSAFAGGG